MQGRRPCTGWCRTKASCNQCHDGLLWPAVASCVPSPQASRYSYLPVLTRTAAAPAWRAHQPTPWAPYADTKPQGQCRRKQRANRPPCWWLHAWLKMWLCRNGCFSQQHQAATLAAYLAPMESCALRLPVVAGAASAMRCSNEVSHSLSAMHTLVALVTAAAQLFFTLRGVGFTTCICVSALSTIVVDMGWSRHCRPSTHSYLAPCTSSGLYRRL